MRLSQPAIRWAIDRAEYGGSGRTRFETISPWMRMHKRPECFLLLEDTLMGRVRTSSLQSFPRLWRLRLVHARKGTTLSCALNQNGGRRHVKHLLAMGAPPVDVLEGVRFDDLIILDLCLAFGMDPTECLRRIQVQNYHAVKKLYRAGADPHGFNPFRTAIRYNPDLVSLHLTKLVESGDISRGDYQGQTWLFQCAPDHIEDILKIGVDPDKQDHEGRTALMHRCKCGFFLYSTLRALIKNANIQDYKGRNILMYLAPQWTIMLAPQSGTAIQIIKSMIERGLDIHARDNENKTVLDLHVAELEKLAPGGPFLREQRRKLYVDIVDYLRTI